MSYQETRDQLSSFRKQIFDIREKMHAVQADIEPQAVDDYTFQSMEDQPITLEALFGDKDDVEMATGEVIDRMKEALIGVAVETRQPYKSGITRFERILPGADRMYPDTDTPPTRVDQDLTNSN